MTTRQMRIFGWAAAYDACWHYRLRLPLQQLATRGHHTHSAQTLQGDWLYKSDIVIGQRVCTPRVVPHWRTLASIRDNTGSPRLVYEVDDDLFTVDHTNPTHEVYSRPDIQDAIRECAKLADLVTVSTPTLAEVMGQHNPNVVVLPNCVDQRLLDIPRPDPTDRPVVFGWQGGNTHAADFATIAQPLGRVLRTHPDTQMWFFGHAHPDRLPPAQIRHAAGIRAFAPGQPADGSLAGRDYYLQVAKFHVGLAPLAPTVFNRSKSHLRCLEYAALGIPAVASDSPAYNQTVRHGTTGYLAGLDHEWHRYLRMLANEPELRAGLGLDAREHARRWTIEANAHRWEAAYLQLLGWDAKEPDHG